MDTRLLRIRDLITDIAEKEKELGELMGGAEPKTTTRKAQACGKCGEIGHSARTCTAPEKQPT